MIANHSATVIAAGHARKRSNRFPNDNFTFNLKLSIAIVFVAVLFGSILPTDFFNIRAAAQTETPTFTNSGFPYSTPITLIARALNCGSPTPIPTTTRSRYSM